jgi:hypothetical protein
VLSKASRRCVVVEGGGAMGGAQAGVILGGLKASCVGLGLKMEGEGVDFDFDHGAMG